MSEEPIKSQKEADEVFNYLVNETKNALNIPIEEATKRVTALFKSGILEGGNPEDIQTQMRIQAFLMIPSENYSHLK